MELKLKEKSLSLFPEAFLPHQNTEKEVYLLISWKINVNWKSHPPNFSFITSASNFFSIAQVVILSYIITNTRWKSLNY